MNGVVVTGSFDDLKSRHVPFLEEASKLGNVQVILWPKDIRYSRRMSAVTSCKP
jgi:glycerol-3-phosphate cytidylyltransferase-like family protein